MKIFTFLFSLILLALICSFGYFAMIDVDVEQSEVTKTLPNDSFIK